MRLTRAFATRPAPRDVRHRRGTDARLDRSEALLDGDRARLGAVAAGLEGVGCPYQWARTLVFAGGSDAERGRREMAALGASPMTESTPPTT